MMVAAVRLPRPAGGNPLCYAEELPLGIHGGRVIRLSSEKNHINRM